MSHNATDTENNLTAKETPVTAARSTVEIRPIGPDSRRVGFTLVELLVVIGIIALLAALITPAVIGARTSARNAAIKAEIDMLHMAIMNYKNEYGSFPPCADPNPAARPDGTGRLVSQAQKHVQRLFPRCPDIPGQFTGAGQITPQNAVFSWLGGYTENPASPLQPPNERKKLFDFDQSRVAGGSYYPAGLRTIPYQYLDSGSYSALSPPTSSVALDSVFVHVYPDDVLTNGARRQTPSWWAGLSEAKKNAWRFSLSENPAERPFQRLMNEDTFQLFSAGLDGEFGTDDDLSNCWSGTRKQYLDSLKQ